MTDNKKQFDVQGLLTNLKTMINPAGNTPDPSPEDAVGVKLAELSVMVQELQEEYSEQGKKLAKMNKLFNEVYRDLEVFRKKGDKPEE